MTLTKPWIRSNLAGHCCCVAPVHSVLLHLWWLLATPASHGHLHQTRAGTRQCSWLPALPLQRAFAHAGPTQDLMQGKASMPPQGQALPGILYPPGHSPGHLCILPGILLGFILLGIPSVIPASSWAPPQASPYPSGHPCNLPSIPLGTHVSSWASLQAFPRPPRHHSTLPGRPSGIPASPQKSLHAPRHSNTSQSNSHSSSIKALPSLGSQNPSKPELISQLLLGPVTCPSWWGRPSPQDSTLRVSHVSLAALPTRDAPSAGPSFG